MSVKKKIVKIITKIIVFPVYIIYLCVIAYLFGYPKDVWDKWSSCIDKKVDKKLKK